MTQERIFDRGFDFNPQELFFIPTYPQGQLKTGLLIFYPPVQTKPGFELSIYGVQCSFVEASWFKLRPRSRSSGLVAGSSSAQLQPLECTQSS